MCNKNMLLLCFIFIFFVNTLVSNTIGSDTAVQEFTSQQLLQSGDRVAGFAWLKSGFSLQGLNTTATFDSLFPVSGTVALNAGNLLLNTDLVFNNNANFYTLGNIIGNSHLIDFSSSVTAIASIDTAIGANSFVRNITRNMGTQVVAADWSYDSKYLAVCLANNGGNELYLFTYDGIILTQLDAINIGNHAIDVNWHPSQYLLALGCASSPQIRIYSVSDSSPNLSNVISSIPLASTVSWATAVCYDQGGNYLAVGTNNISQQLIVFPCNGDGTLDSGGRFTISFGSSVSVSTEALSWNSTNEYLALGCSNSGGTFNELRVYNVTTSPLSVTLNASLLLGAVGGVDWIPSTTHQLFAALVTSPALKAYNHDGSIGSLTQIASNTQPTLVRCVSVDPSYGYVAISCDYAGVDPELIIYNYDLTGGGSFTSLFTDDSFGTSQMDALGWSPNGQYIVYGDVAGFFYIANRQGLSFLSNCFTFSDVYLSMNNDLYLQNACITFGGNCAIYGNGNTLTLLPTSTIYIDSNSKLLFENVKVSGIAGNNIQAVDDTSLLVFNNSVWNLLGDYSFLRGAFSIINSFMVRGYDKQFFYITDMVSTVSQNSSFIIDSSMTFNYTPSSNVNNLLQFTDQTSFFSLINASFFVSSAGLALKNGTCTIDGLCSITSTGTSAAQGIIFGDGVIVNNNMSINLLPAAELDIQSGFVVNKNI